MEKDTTERTSNNYRAGVSQTMSRVCSGAGSPNSCGPIMIMTRMMNGRKPQAKRNWGNPVTAEHDGLPGMLDSCEYLADVHRKHSNECGILGFRDVLLNRIPHGS